jgi:hypothetical protein
MSFISTDLHSHESENTWYTPKLFTEVHNFDLDPCTNSTRPFNTAIKHIEHDKGECGLSIDWNGDVWLNPPYGKAIMPFVDKFNNYKKGVMLVFARMGAVYIQESLKNGAYIYCLRKRIAFIDKHGKKATNAGADSCLVFYDLKFYEIYKKHFEGVLIKALIGEE